MDEELESFLTAHQEYGHFNNTVLVSQSDESIFARGYGEAVREHGIPNAVEIKSLAVTKWNTGALVALASLYWNRYIPRARSPRTLIYKWRLEQEYNMKAKNGGKGMNDEAVKAFVDRYIPGYMFFQVGVTEGTHKGIRDPTTGERIAPPWVGKGPRVLIGEERQVVGTEALAF
ncbi:hypothetical protein GLOTRDRAFT_132655 [Gloeophyllum trabeum ATCC 11539]|uniref:Uncharacterized protein n=1 Tax=Gloeophyllum trabeum (strain ATCC 11539 / FP-39264 / Madison 617) TaxID=670483 RepID=S7RGZ5_GLOTA|nr:uncharacterized protein GLOTRDRAFT_132655 [Gloeophyllum trabeum ATCC 11539]EPQ51844.1 hypothetical protein GLOTRDRAFT_132655 [Gloeophyllum trabeum ATCC 11539]